MIILLLFAITIGVIGAIVPLYFYRKAMIEWEEVDKMMRIEKNRKRSLDVRVG